MKTLRTVAACGLLVSALFSAPVSAFAETPQFEVRVNTGMPGLGLGGIIDTAPGAIYLFDSELLIINLDAGVGAVVAGNLVVGLNAGFILNENTNAASNTIYNARIGPYLRYAPGIQNRSSSFFGELYGALGVLHIDGNDDVLIGNIGFWAGWQAFVSSEAAITLGPYAEYINLDGENEGLIGVRFGVSIYP